MESNSKAQPETTDKTSDKSVNKTSSEENTQANVNGGNNSSNKIGQNPIEEPKSVETSKESESKDWWDKADVIGKIIGSLLVPIVLAGTGFYINWTLQDRANKQKTLEIAIGVLQSKSANETPDLKNWAFNVFEDAANMANHPLQPQVEQELKQKPLPGGVLAPIDEIETKPEGIVGIKYKSEGFKEYLRNVELQGWRPKFVVLHHLVSPTLSEWRAKTNEGKTVKFLVNMLNSRGISVPPHLIIDDEGIWILTPPTRSGIHSPSWNKDSIGVMMVGNYTMEPFDEKVRDNTVQAIAALDSVFNLDASALRFHKDDPRVAGLRDCPGNNVDKNDLIERVKAVSTSQQ